LCVSRKKPDPTKEGIGNSGGVRGSRALKIPVG